MFTVYKYLILLGIFFTVVATSFYYEASTLKEQLRSEIISSYKISNEKLRAGSVREFFDSLIHSPGRILIIEGRPLFSFPNPPIKSFDSVCVSEATSLSTFTKITLCRSLMDQRGNQILCLSSLFICLLLIFLIWKSSKDSHHQKKLRVEMLKSQKLLHDLKGPLTTIRVLTSKRNEHDELLTEAYQSIRTILASDKINTEANISIDAIATRLKLLYPHVDISALQLVNPLRLTPHQERIVFNIAQNACEAKMVDNKVRIKTEKSLTGRVRIIVTDRGSGIPKQILRGMNLGRVTTTKTNGSGLGLFSAQSSATIVNASIRFRSSTKGTTAFITL